MVEGPRSLADAFLAWITDRLLLARTSSLPQPRWPPTSECREALACGQVSEAVGLPDAKDARYLIVDHLRCDAPHLLLARDQALDRDVVIKLIRAPNQLAQIVAAREARITAALRHPNIVAVHDVDLDGAYMVLELLDGDMRELQGIEPGLLLDAYIQAGRGLAAAHARGIWHLDFKPENVLVHVERDRSGRVTKLSAKVTDFGCAKVIAPGQATTGDAGAVQAGQRAGGALEDQHAFAVAVWETLTGGRRPPDGFELLAPELHAVLSRALMADPSQRWADMAALVDAIERGRAGTAALEDASGPPGSSRSIEWAISFAEDGLVSASTRAWRNARVALAGNHAELGRGGFALGATLLGSAAEASGSAQRRGLAQSIDVLEEAIDHLEAAGDFDVARYACSLAAAACDEFGALYINGSREQQQLEQRAASFRARGREDDA